MNIARLILNNFKKFELLEPSFDCGINIFSKIQKLTLLAKNNDII